MFHTEAITRLLQIVTYAVVKKNGNIMEDKDSTMMQALYCW